MTNYINNLETNHIELHFEKSDYMALSAEQKTELKSAFNWSRYAKAWVSKSTRDHYRALQIAKKLGFTEEEKQGKRLTFAEEMERKAEKAERRAERMETHAENAEKRAGSYQAEFNKCRQDWSWLTQPNINSSAGRRFTKQREKVMTRYEKGFEEYRKSEYFKERAATARGTASMAQLEDPVYIAKKIKECQKEIKLLVKLVTRTEDNLYRVENGEELKNYYGDIIKAEKLQENLLTLADKLEYQIDKQAYMENAMDAIRATGRKIYTKDDIKPGYFVKARYGWQEVSKTGSTKFYTKDGSIYGNIYAEIKEVKIPEGWTEPKNEAHNVKEGEIFTKNNTCGQIIRAYQVVKTTAKTVQIREIAVADNQSPLRDRFINEKIERKTVKKKNDGTTVLYDGHWFLYKYVN